MTKLKLSSIDKIVIIFLGSLLFIISPLVLFIFPKIMNPLSTYLFQIINLFLGGYITYRISTLSAMNETIKLQKNTAKTAVRHIRIYGQDIQNLIDNISEKIPSARDRRQNNYFTEIINHLKIIRIGINSSENDFKDILGEELKEETKIINELIQDQQILKLKLIESEKLRKDNENANRQSLEILQEDINKLRTDISDKYHNLPIGTAVGNPYEELTLQSGFAGVLGAQGVQPGFSEFIPEGLRGTISLRSTTIVSDTEKDKKKKDNK